MLKKRMSGYPFVTKKQKLFKKQLPLDGKSKLTKATQYHQAGSF
jgi:hypothetical protein